jgi:NAD(P)-dependent dehydrogenase (short-subunit alcohol dehydrogenase family)
MKGHPVVDTPLPAVSNIALRATGSIIITGTASGIGQRTAELFVEAGAMVTASDINPTEAMTPWGMQRVSQGDISDEAYIVDLLDEASQDGPLRGVVHCAGIFDKTQLDSDLESWHRVLETNTTSSFLLLKHAVPRIVESGGGNIVLIGSVSGINGGYKAGPAYGASKAGVHALVKWAARRYAASGIRVNAIAPGIISTPLMQASGVSTDLIPSGTAGTPLDIAQAALYLSSSAASFVNGTVLVVDGGMTI